MDPFLAVAILVTQFMVFVPPNAKLAEEIQKTFKEKISMENIETIIDFFIDNYKISCRHFECFRLFFTTNHENTLDTSVLKEFLNMCWLCGHPDLEDNKDRAVEHLLVVLEKLLNMLHTYRKQNPSFWPEPVEKNQVFSDTNLGFEILVLIQKDGIKISRVPVGGERRLRSSTPVNDGVAEATTEEAVSILNPVGLKSPARGETPTPSVLAPVEEAPVEPKPDEPKPDEPKPDEPKPDEPVQFGPQVPAVDHIPKPTPSPSVENTQPKTFADLVTDMKDKGEVFKRPPSPPSDPQEFLGNHIEGTLRYTCSGNHALVIPSKQGKILFLQFASWYQGYPGIRVRYLKTDVTLHHKNPSQLWPKTGFKMEWFNEETERWVKWE